LFEGVPAGVAVGEMHLQQCPLFIGDLSRVEECTEGSELIMKLRIHRLRSSAVQIFINSLTLSVLMGEEVRAESFQGPVIVVTYISDRLTGLFGNLTEAVSLKEMKFQGLLLIRGKLPSQSV
jgi:hypothetical protein